MRVLAASALVLTLSVGLLPSAATPVAAATFTAGVSLSDFEDFGVQARWLRPFLLRGSDLSTGLTYFFDGSYLAFDGDLHLRLAEPLPRRLYPLLGLRLATDFDNSSLDVNLGAGIDLKLGKRTAAALEAKFVLGDSSPFVATFSVFF